MSKGSRRKRATRPWQDQQAMRGFTGLTSHAWLDPDLELEGYEVRMIDEGEKDYICPDCGNTIHEGESHVVVWPEGDSDLRRHWHTHCWRIEVRASADGR